MVFLSRNDLDNLLEFKTIFEKTKQAYILYSEGKTITPPFTVFTIPKSKGSVHFKCGYVPGEPYFAMKYSGVFYGNEKKGLSNYLGLFTIFNAKTGEVEAVVDDKGYLTDYRTAVAGAIATSSMANRDSKVVAMIGTGIQARMQLMALMNVMDIEVVKVWGRTKSNVKKYINDMKLKFPKLKFIECKTAEIAVADADIVYTVTCSEKPLIKAEWLKKGAHITAVGACEPKMQELDEKIFLIANRICVDSKDACLNNGELHHAYEENCVKLDDVCELGYYLSQRKKRKSSDITICDLVGLGFQDATIASTVMEKYKKLKNRAIS